MAELKTLKEMTREPDGGNAIDADDLRSEAIKWVKHEIALGKLGENEVPESVHWSDEDNCIAYMIREIREDWNLQRPFQASIALMMHFFNIKDEELK